MLLWDINNCSSRAIKKEREKRDPNSFRNRSLLGFFIHREKREFEFWKKHFVPWISKIVEKKSNKLQKTRLKNEKKIKKKRILKCNMRFSRRKNSRRKSERFSFYNFEWISNKY